MKTCCRCREAKALDAFARRTRDKDGRQPYCRECAAIANREHYERSPARRQRIRESNTALIQRKRELVGAYLKEHPCVDCGEDDILVLEFDHMSGKTSEISTMIRNCTAEAKLRAEIAKCVVRCSNCHRRKTAQQLGSWRLAFAAAIV